MSPRFLVSAFLVVASVGLCGCYDLGDPTGPRPEDFQAQKAAQENAVNAENNETEHSDTATANCPDGTCAPLPVAALREDVTVAEAERKAGEPDSEVFATAQK